MENKKDRIRKIELEKIIGAYLGSPSYTKEELDLVDEFAYLYVNHGYNLNIECYPFEDYVIKSDTLNYVQDFLYSLNPKYVDELKQALKDGSISFIQNKRKKRIEQPSEYEVMASHHLKDSFDLIHNFFQYWIRKQVRLSKETDYFVDTFSILAEFLFQDYLESLGCKNAEPYYSKMNRFIYTNIFAVHMIVELKLIEIYMKTQQLKEDNIIDLKQSNLMTKELLSKHCEIMIDDILSMGSISLHFHKRYLYGIIFASFIHQKLLKNPKLIQSFCYLIDNPENISVTCFMSTLGITLEDNKGKLSISKKGILELRTSYLKELEDTITRVNVDYRKK